jgi:hypothetical protein
VCVALFKAELNFRKVQVVSNRCMPDPFIAQGRAVTLCPRARQVVPGGWKPITVLGFLWLGIANDGLSGSWSSPCLIALPRRARLATWLHPVASPDTIAVPCEWSTGPVLQCSFIVAACLHVLQALNAQLARASCRLMMALTLGVLETCMHTLETREPSCIGRPTRPFSIYLRPVALWERRDAWQRRYSHWSGDRVRSHRTRGSVGAHLCREVRSGAIGHVAVPEPTSAGRQGPEP